MIVVKPRDEKNYMECSQCGISKEITRNFYKIDSKVYKATGRYPVCRNCIKDNIGVTKESDPYDSHLINNIQRQLQEMNKPFLYGDYESAVNEIRFGKKRVSMESIFGIYYKTMYANHSNETYADSQFENEPNEKENISSPSIKYEDSTTDEEFKITNKIINKWGSGYSNDEYRSFENKYALLKNNYQEKTAMHTEALLTYIRYRVKEELATASGNVKDAKDWGALATKAAQDAKINPSQLSKSDLSDGLDTFGQLVRSVEQAVDIIPILPQFKQRPQDKVDFTLLCYINYIRDLKGLPLATYEEIYEFYEERKKEYENRGVDE